MIAKVVFFIWYMVSGVIWFEVCGYELTKGYGDRIYPSDLKIFLFSALALAPAILNLLVIGPLVYRAVDRYNEWFGKRFWDQPKNK